MHVRHSIRLAAGAALIALLPGAAAVASPPPSQDPLAQIERVFEVAGRPVIALKNVDGTVRVRAWESPQVLVRATREVRGAASHDRARRAAQEVEIRIEQVGSRIEVEARHPRGVSIFGLRPKVLVHFEVSAPAASDLEASSVDGSLDVDGFDGRLTLSTVDGDLKVHGCSGRMDVRTVDGSLLVDRAGGEVAVRSVDGKITLNGRLDALEAHSTDGRIEIDVAPGSRMTRNWSVRTTDGGIVIRLPSGFDADIEARTGDGRIQSEHSLTVERESSRRILRGRLNNGGNVLEIRSTDGNITIGRS